MRRIRLTSLANIDYAESVKWYEEKEPGLGQEFEAELELLFERIQKNPQLFPKFSATVQQARLPRFKHKILFTVAGNEIGILAIFHPSRNPDSLRKRV